jgi:hypothetical protein
MTILDFIMQPFWMPINNTDVFLIALLLLIAHSPIFWHAIIEQISCSLVNEMQNTNRTSGLKIMKNQNNRKVLQIIRLKCAGNAIDAKQERLVARSVKVILTN